jgi:hypothetical protein
MLPDDQETFDALQRMEQGKMQQLGDRLLPTMHPLLHGLKPNGMNLEGKTTKGVPDSFVGDAPETCRAAVEYTTQADRLEKKLSDDYAGVRRHCPQATTIVLCTNRPTGPLDLTDLKNKANAEKIDLTIIGGRQLAQWLCQERQDLRQHFLGIPIGAHTGISLLHAMRDRLDIATAGSVDVLERFVARPQAERAVTDATQQHRAVFLLIVAPAGTGKTTWSIEHARRHSWTEPVLWIPAVALQVGLIDPLGLAITHAAYGSEDAARLLELSDLLRRERRFLRVVVDAIDEARDYEALRRCLGAFQRGALGPFGRVLLTCREEALPLLQETLGGIYPDLFKPRERGPGAGGGRIQLEGLGREAAYALLEKEEATPVQARAIEEALPTQYFGNALFLRRTLDLVRQGELPVPNDRWIEAFAEHFVKDIQRRLQKDGRSPAAVRIRTFLGELALRVMESPGAAVSDESFADLPGAEEEGESTLLGRAIQVGVLTRKGTAGVGFAHSLFLEHFAAWAVTREHGWEAWLRRLGNASVRRLAPRLMVSLAEPLPALRALFARDPRAACEAAAQLKAKAVDDADLRRALLEEPRRLLASRFPSDKEEGLRLLASLRWPEAAQLAVSWYNALSPEEKARWNEEAAELFLSLEVSEACGVVVCHEGLWTEFDWYEPSFSQRIDSLGPRFQNALRRSAWAWLEAEQVEHMRLRLVKLLALLRDPWLVEYLRGRVEQGPLRGPEHRALIFLNTFESIQVYAESVERFWQDGEEKTGIEEEEIVIKYDDVLMFPHDQLVELAEAALMSPVERHVLLVPYG